MTSNEAERSGELATQSQLHHLFDTFSTSLVRLGEFDQDKPQPVLGWRDGFPVYKYLNIEGYDLVVPAVALQKVVPDAQQTLDIRGLLNAWFTPGYFCISGENVGAGISFEPPIVTLILSNDDGVDRHFDVEDLGSALAPDRYKGETSTEIYDGTPYEQKLAMKYLDQMTGRSAIVHELGLDQIGFSECQALQQIADNLDRLVGESR